MQVRAAQIERLFERRAALELSRHSLHAPMDRHPVGEAVRVHHHRPHALGRRADPDRGVDERHARHPIRRTCESRLSPSAHRNGCAFRPPLIASDELRTTSLRGERLAALPLASACSIAASSACRRTPSSSAARVVARQQVAVEPRHQRPQQLWPLAGDRGGDGARDAAGGSDAARPTRTSGRASSRCVAIRSIIVAVGDDVRARRRRATGRRRLAPSRRAASACDDVALVDRLRAVRRHGGSGRAPAGARSGARASGTSAIARRSRSRRAAPPSRAAAVEQAPLDREPAREVGGRARSPAGCSPPR